MSDNLIEPHGGKLFDVMAEPGRRAELRTEARDLVSWHLTPRQTWDLELLMNGGFSPLQSFMGKEDYTTVCADMRTADGTLWPIPVVLDVSEEFAGGLVPGERIALRDPEGVLLAILTAEDHWRPDRQAEAALVYGTTSPEHPGVERLLRQTGPRYIAGPLEGVELRPHYDFRSLRYSPAELRKAFADLGWTRVVAFQTRNPMHRAHIELTLRAAEEAQANLLIHPVVGLTKPGDVDHYTRVRAYEAAMQRYPAYTAKLALLPLAMRMAGPREAMWHAIIRKNYGCSHFIIGRDHAGPGSDSAGKPFYDPYAAQELVSAHSDELGVEMVPFRAMVYVEELDAYRPVDEVLQGMRTRSISGTEMRERLAAGTDLPEWFTFPEVAAELRRTYRPRHQQGFTVFFTGLSGAGKSTIAKVLTVKLLEIGGRPVTLLDGDIVRQNLSSELGFSKEHRDLNIRRIGFVASEITKNGGIAICAPIAPYDHTRKNVRQMIDGLGGFVLVHVSTPLEVCEQRDAKGLYAKARAGLLPEFTGISDPYEEPGDAEVTINTTDTTPDEAVIRIILHLEQMGFVGGGADYAAG